MKICFVNVLYSKPSDRGGLGAHIAALSCELAKRGHDVTIITSGRGESHVQEGVRIVFAGDVHRYSNPRQLCNPAYLLARLLYMVRSTHYILSESFEVAEFADGGLEQLFLAFIRNCSLITKLHGNFRFSFSHGGTIQDWIERIEAVVVRRSDSIYASTNKYAEQIADAYQIPVGRIAIVPCGIDTTAIRNFQPVDLTHQYPQIQGKRMVVLSVGNSPHRKGAPLFLETARLLRRQDALFVLFCDDAEFLADAQVPENVLVLKNLDQAGFYNWIAASEIVAFPSSAESFSIAMHEAMLFRKIVVVSPLVPFEGIDCEYPRVVRLQELHAPALACALADVLDGRKKLPHSSEDACRRFDQYYDIGRIADLTESLYRQAILPCAADQARVRTSR